MFRCKHLQKKSSCYRIRSNTFCFFPPKDVQSTPDTDAEYQTDTDILGIRVITINVIERPGNKLVPFITHTAAAIKSRSLTGISLFLSIEERSFSCYRETRWRKPDFPKRRNITNRYSFPECLIAVHLKMCHIIDNLQ